MLSSYSATLRVPLQQEKPKVLKKPRFSKVSAIKPEQKGLNLQLKVFKLLACKGGALSNCLLRPLWMGLFILKDEGRCRYL